MPGYSTVSSARSSLQMDFNCLAPPYSGLQTSEVFIINLTVNYLHNFLQLFGWLGIVPAIGVFMGVFEETGFKPAGAINAISYILWSVWLIAFGVALSLR